MTYRILVAALVLAGAPPEDAAAAGAEDPPTPAGVLTKAPELVAPAEPAYPEAAKTAGLEGEVTLELELSEAGEVTDAVVTGPAGHGFDEAALEAARRLRFTPAEIDGVPSPVRIEYRFRFTLEAVAPPPPAEEAPPPAGETPPSVGEAVVVGERDREVARVAISQGEIRRVPGVSGDAVKVIQNLPGVARAPGGLGLLVVRGGNPRDTRVYVDGIEVPLTFHFGGLTSVYAADLVDRVEFEAGNFGVRSGRAIAGRVNLVTRDPGERTHLVADANLFHATVLAEGRTEGDVGYAVAARRSYADAVITAALESAEDGPNVSVAPRYYDFQAKLAFEPTPDDRVRFDA
ncbi:MAG TPA: TonB family protein, partial [Anaeromyxobacteraceae bacterium]|nr:TonB family protein [Anaeromyxobacteraceae bacterium]